MQYQRYVSQVGRRTAVVLGVLVLGVAACDGGSADEESGDRAELEQETLTEESTSEDDSSTSPDDTDTGDEPAGERGEDPQDDAAMDDSNDGDESEDGNDGIDLPDVSVPTPSLPGSGDDHDDEGDTGPGDADEGDGDEGDGDAEGLSPSPVPSPDESGDDDVDSGAEDTSSGGDESLPDEWYEASGSDGIPDFVKAEFMDEDPQVPLCVGEVDCPGVSLVDGQLGPVQESVMLLLDASGSMADELPDGQKMDLAKDAIEFFATATPATTDLGFGVFGHAGSMDPEDFEESCSEIGILAELGEADHESVPPLLDDFSATGFTPLALALETAGEQFDGREDGANRVILVSDGLETCDGDPVAVAQSLHSSGIELVVDVIAYDVPDEEHAALEEIAEAAGGEFLVANTGGELAERAADLARTQAEGVVGALCVMTNSTVVINCLSQASATRLASAFGDAADDGDYSEEQLDDIDEIESEAQDWVRGQRDVISDWSSGELDAYEEALDEANERIREKYGEELTLNWTEWTCARIASLPVG